MSASSNETTTLFRLGMEKIRAWLNGDSSGQKDGRPAMPDVYNPLGFRLGGFVGIETVALMKHTFSVESMSEFTRHIGKKHLVFTDYSLHDPGDGSEEEKWVTVRVIPEDGGKHSCYLLTPKDELVYDKALIQALDGNQIEDNETHVVYRKVGVYKAAIREISGDGVLRLDVRYWDHINEEEPKLRLHIAELDLTDREGTIQTYLGVPVSRDDIKGIAGHV